MDRSLLKASRQGTAQPTYGPCSVGFCSGPGLVASLRNGRSIRAGTIGRIFPQCGNCDSPAARLGHGQPAPLATVSLCKRDSSALRVAASSRPPGRLPDQHIETAVRRKVALANLELSGPAGFTRSPQKLTSFLGSPLSTTSRKSAIGFSLLSSAAWAID